MPKPFGKFDGLELGEDLLSKKGQIEEEFAELERLFDELHSSTDRLIAIPGVGLAPLAAPYEIATTQALRALKLTEGAVSLLETSNIVAAIPVVRSLFETWIALAYADMRFRELVIEGNKWSQFNTLAKRLLMQMSSREGDSKEDLIGIGMMLDHVVKPYADGRVGPDGQVGTDAWLRSVYAQLCDGTHPTLWGLTPYGRVRPDGLGMDWSGEAEAYGVMAVMSDLEFSLGLVIRAVRSLRSTADEVGQGFRDAGIGANPESRKQSIDVLERMIQSPPDLSPEALRIFRERSGPLLDYLRRAEDESHGAGVDSESDGNSPALP